MNEKSTKASKPVSEKIVKLKRIKNRKVEERNMIEEFEYIEDEFDDVEIEPGCEFCGNVMEESDITSAKRSMRGWLCRSCLRKELAEEI